MDGEHMEAAVQFSNAMVDNLAPHIPDPCYFPQNMSSDDMEELANWNFGQLFWLSNENAPENDENSPESDENAPGSDGNAPASDDQMPESDDQTPESDDQTTERNGNAPLELAKEMAE